MVISAKTDHVNDLKGSFSLMRQIQVWLEAFELKVILKGECL